jgi:hypothetical protein
VVCSDETSARVSGKNWWEWVFVGTLAGLPLGEQGAVIKAEACWLLGDVDVNGSTRERRGHNQGQMPSEHRKPPASLCRSVQRGSRGGRGGAGDTSR